VASDAETPDLVVDELLETGEGPLWHEDEQRLYWVDIPPGRLYRYDPGTNRHEMVHDAGEAIGGYTIQADAALLLFGARGSVRRWRDGEVTSLIEAIPEETNSRFNDVIADPEGRVFCGTMPVGERPGRLYRLDLDGSLTIVLDDAGLSNGMGFTTDLDGFYHTDTNKGTITRFAYDRATGALANPKVVVTVPSGEGIPDGMTVDANGDIWSARWDGGALIHYSASGEEFGRVPFPARKVSSVTFAGATWSDVYVTTALGQSGDRATEGAGAGALFRLSLCVSGRPPFRSRIVV